MGVGPLETDIIASTAPKDYDAGLFASGSMTRSGSALPPRKVPEDQPEIDRVAALFARSHRVVAYAEQLEREAFVGIRQRCAGAAQLVVGRLKVAVLSDGHRPVVREGRAE